MASPMGVGIVGGATGGGPGLASPGQGVPATSILSLLAQAASNAPALAQDQQAKKLALQQQQQTLDENKKKMAADQLNAILQYVKNNPKLASDSSLLAQAKQLSKESGIPLPLSMGQAATPASAGQYQVGSGTPSTAGGSMDLGASDIGGTGGASGVGPSVTQTQAPQAASAGSPAGAGEQIDVAALTPRKSADELLANPTFLEDASALTPEQRQAYYGDYQGLPAGFFTAPTRPTTAQINGAVSIFRTMAAKGDPASIQAALQFVQKTYPGIDASMLVTPDVAAGANALEVKRINMLQQAGILKGDQVRQAIALSQARIQRLTQQNDYTKAATANMDLKNQYFASDEGRKTREADSIVAARAKNLKIAQDKLDQAIAQNNIRDTRLAQNEVGTLRNQLAQERDRLQAQAAKIELSDTPDIPDPNDPTQTYTQAIAARLADVNAQIDQADQKLKLASAPKTANAAMQKTGVAGPGTVTGVSGDYAVKRRNPQTGQVIGSNDGGVTWRDVKTGQLIQ